MVVDPGVLVSAAISDAGPPARLVGAQADRLIRMVVSPLLLEELGGVLERPKFRSRLPRDMARAYLRALSDECELVADPPPGPVALTPDPDDDYLVRLARACGAQAIVSSDAHLTGLADPDPPVLTPRQFLERLAAP